MHASRNIEARLRNHCCRGKAIIINYNECVCSLSYPACKGHAPYFIVNCDLSDYHSLLHKRHDFRGGVTGHKMCVLILSTIFFFWNISHSKRNPARYHNCTYCTVQYIGLHVKYPFFFVLLMKHACYLYGEVNSVKNTTINIWLNDGVYWQWKNYMFRPTAAIFRFWQLSC